MLMAAALYPEPGSPGWNHHEKYHQTHITTAQAGVERRDYNPKSRELHRFLLRHTAAEFL
jgi:hypothetical protein